MIAAVLAIACAYLLYPTRSPGIVRAQGFRTIAVAGLYPLQGELSTLVQGSVLRGLGGLMAAFAVIVLVVTRSTITICLAVTPLALFGIVSLSRMPLDIIAAPAANVALPLGIEEMIHLGHRVRHARAGGPAICGRLGKRRSSTCGNPSSPRCLSWYLDLRCFFCPISHPHNG
jgi:hypothetical protein